MARRLFLLGCLFLFAALDYVFLIFLLGRRRSFAARARWFHFWAKVFMWIINGGVKFKGQPPKSGLVVCNHLSYADIIVLGSIFPLVIVSKSEVRNWPVIGPLTNCAGTLFIRRASKADVLRIGQEMKTVVDSGMVLALFLEGTTTTGEIVLPFHSSLLAPAEQNNWPVTPVWLHYHLSEGQVPEDVCYVGDATFFPHSLNMMKQKKSFEAFVSFGEPITEKMDRKEMARELHMRVCRLKDDHLGAKPDDAALAAKS
jgi:1-acyl-sn-glycerol-3-phosphate acyltransferase